jgi:hypothetical protein
VTPYFESIIGFDPDGIRRIYASTWIEARQEARNYIRNRPDTAPLSAWRFDLVKTPANVMGGSFRGAMKPAGKAWASVQQRSS